MANSITAKSVVFEFANNWGNTLKMTLRSIEFSLNGVVIPLTTSDFAAVSTTNAAPAHTAANAFDTTLSKIGTRDYTSYGAAYQKVTNQRLVVTFNIPQSFDSIIINNDHNNGVLSSYGIKTTKITTSTDTITSTVYNAEISNATAIFAGVIPQHAVVNAADDYVVPIVIPDPPSEATPVRNLVDQITDDTAVLRNLLDQQYSIAETTIRTLFSQSTTSSIKIRALVEQIMADCARLRTTFEQSYCDASRIRSEVIQTWNHLTALRAELDQHYSLAGASVRAELDQVYDLLTLDKIRAELEQIYILAAGEAIVQRVDITVTAIVDGERHVLESCYNVHDEVDEGVFHLQGELQLADADEYALCRHLETIIEIMDDGELMRLMVESPRRSRYEDRVEYVVPLVSESVLLDHSESAYSVISGTSFTGMAKDIVTSLAAPVCMLDWQLSQQMLTVTVGDETAMQLIKRIVESVRGVVQTAPDGTLICRPEYPDDVDKYFDRTPDLTVTDQDDFFQIIPQDSPRDGYNAFYVTDYATASGGLRLETKEISGLQSEVHVFMSPWQANASVILHHSGGAWVSIVENGVVTETVSEQVEFVAGAGSVSKPCYGNLLVHFMETELGEVRFIEDGTLTALVAENSLADVSYTTKYHSFTVRTDRIEDVQVFPEVVYVQ